MPKTSKRGYKPPKYKPKSRSRKKSVKSNPRVGKDVTGISWIFFFSHNLLSAGIFFLVAYILGWGELQNDSLGFFFEFEFWSFFIQVYAIVILIGLLSRSSVLFLINKSIERANKKSTKYLRPNVRWGQLNVRINRLGKAWLFSLFVSCILFVFGVQSVLEAKMFGVDLSIWTFILAYSLIKMGVLIATYYVFNRK